MLRPAVPLLVLLVFALGATERTKVGGVSTLQVQVSGNGSVTSDPGAISCPNSCADQYDTGSRVTLTAHPGATGGFIGWGGACSGTADTCVVLLDADKSVSATFQPAPTPIVSINDVSVTEGNSGTSVAVLTATLSSKTSEAVTVNYATSDGTASAADYVPATGTLTFAPGSATATISVLVNGDTVHEPDETVFVDLSSPVNAEIGDGRGVLAVVDDDPPAIGAGVNASWRVHRTFTRLVRLDAVRVPSDSTIELRCRSTTRRGCPFGRKRLSISAARAQVQLAALFASRRNLVPGTRLEVRITKPGTIGKVITYAIRRGRLPSSSTLCLPPGAENPTAC